MGFRFLGPEALVAMQRTFNPRNRVRLPAGLHIRVKNMPYSEPPTLYKENEMTQPLTKASLQDLSEEELAALKKQATRQIVKFVAIKVGVTVSIAVAAHLITKKLDAAAAVDAVTNLAE